MNETTAMDAQWAVVELFGHTKIAGKVSEEQRFGTTLCRVDVPDVTGFQGETIPGHTKFYGGASIYSLTPCSEDVARLVAQHIKSEPVKIYIPELYPQSQKLIPSGVVDDGRDYDEEEL